MQKLQCWTNSQDSSEITRGTGYPNFAHVTVTRMHTHTHTRMYTTTTDLVETGKVTLRGESGMDHSVDRQRPNAV